MRLLLDYHFKNNFDELKTTFIKLEVDVNISRNANSKPSDRLISVERKCFVNDHYSRIECLEISDIPSRVKDKELETKVPTILE